MTMRTRRRRGHPSLPDHTLRAGSCREIGGALMCVRTKPIVPAATGPSEPVAQAQALWWGGGLFVLLLFAGIAWRRNAPRAQG